MKARPFFDRMSAKTVSDVFQARLREEYRLPPAAVRTLGEELQRYAQLTDHASRCDGQVVFQAVAVEEPPGKPLSECRKVPVRLTLFEPADLARWRDRGRQTQLQEVRLRLAREAQEQGGELTIEDLAFLLRTSPSTVKRRRQELLRQRTVFRLRGDLTDAGPGSTHRQQSVKLFLLGYPETEIAQRTQHRLESVESYVYDFLRVASLCQQGKAPGTICRLVKLSLSKVRTITAFDLDMWAGWTGSHLRM